MTIRNPLELYASFRFLRNSKEASGTLGTLTLMSTKEPYGTFRNPKERILFAHHFKKTKKEKKLLLQMPLVRVGI